MNLSLRDHVCNMVLKYQPIGVAQAVSGAVAHRWQRIPPEERPLFLLAMRQLTEQRALGPDLVSDIHSAG